MVGDVLVLDGVGALALHVLLVPVIEDAERVGRRFDATEQEVLRAVKASASAHMRAGSGRGTGGTATELESATLSARQASDVLGVSDSWMRRKAEKFGGRKVRGEWQFMADEIECARMRRVAR
jgi:hypothetical protein